MSAKFELKCKSELHNYFEIEVYEEGKLKQTAYAQNVITNNFFKTSYEERWFLEVGRGTGEPSASDNSLFSRIGSFAAKANHYIINADNHIYGLEFQCAILPEQMVGEEIREIGISAGWGTPNLLTHAMIKDAEGNPITIHKGPTDEIKIKAHMIATLAYPNSDCYSIVSQNEVKDLCRFLLPVHSNQYSLSNSIITVGIDNETFNKTLGDTYYNSAGSNFEHDDSSKTTTYKRRFKTDELNNVAIHTLVFAGEIAMPVSSLPDWTGFNREDALGMADGIRTEFQIPWPEPTEISVFKNNNLVQSMDYRIENLERYVLYFWDFIKLIGLNRLNNQHRMLVYYKKSNQDIFLAELIDLYCIVLFKVTDENIECICSLENGHLRSGIKSYGDLKTIKIISNNQYFNIVGNEFVPCAESDVISTVEDTRLENPYTFEKGNIKLAPNDAYCLPRKRIVNKKIVFNTPPSANEEIKASYHVNYIPKDDRHVLDVTFATNIRAGQGS